MTDEPVGSRPGRQKLRIVVDGSPALRSRLYALAFELGMSVAEIGRYALWTAVLDAESGKAEFCRKVATEKLKRLEGERAC